MSDKKNFEQEYQYVEEPGTEENLEFKDENLDDPKSKHDPKSEYFSKLNHMMHQPDIRRKGLIAVGALILLIFILKQFSQDEFQKKPPNTELAKTTNNTPQLSNPMLNTPVAQNTTSLSVKSAEVDRLMDIERNVQTNMSSIRDQIGQLTNQVNTLTSSNQALIAQVSELAAKLSASQQALEELLAAKKAKPVITMSRPKISKKQFKDPSLAYYVQAVIPGRAWLINSHGASLTVRVGSKVPGMGVVNRIDPLQGRVMMSSGHVIVFTQAD